MALPPLRYEECGLGQIYLQNGFRRLATRDGVKTSIAHAEALLSEIAGAIVASPDQIRGQELRFVRQHLGMTQSHLAELLGIKRDTVVRWETRRNVAIPGPADRLVRLLVASRSHKQSLAITVMQILTMIRPQEPAGKVFSFGNNQWRYEGQYRDQVRLLAAH